MCSADRSPERHLSNGEDAASSAQLHASREEERLLNDVRRSRAMQREMEEYVLREGGGVPA